MKGQLVHRWRVHCRPKPTASTLSVRQDLMDRVAQAILVTDFFAAAALGSASNVSVQKPAADMAGGGWNAHSHLQAGFVQPQQQQQSVVEPRAAAGILMCWHSTHAYDHQPVLTHAATYNEYGCLIYTYHLPCVLDIDDHDACISTCMLASSINIARHVSGWLRRLAVHGLVLELLSSTSINAEQLLSGLARPIGC